jgi:fatty acid-binding protein 3
MFISNCIPGVGMIQRNLASKAKPVMEWVQQGGKYVQKTTTTFKSFEIVFTLGEEFDEELADGRKSKSVITIEGNKITHKQRSGSTESTITREFNGNEMITKFYCGDVVATRVFKKA